MKSCLNNKDADYAIITSFKKWGGIKDKLDFLWLYFVTVSKYRFYQIFNNKEKTKYYKLKRAGYRAPRYHRVINNVKYPVIGHEQVELSLIRGFDDLGVPFKFDELADNIIALWVDEIDLRIIEKLKKQNKIKKAVTVPTASKRNNNYLGQRFACYDCIDYSLVACEAVREHQVEMVEEKYRNKIKVWPSGVQLGEKVNHTANLSVILFFKLLPIDKNIIDLIESFGIKVYVIEYGYYEFEDWTASFKNADMVIFYQDISESQGIAMAEAWANNKPTLIKSYNGTKKPISPYLTDKQGLFFHSPDELKAILQEYKQDPQKFINRFEPYQWVKENMSDAVSVKNLINIFNE